MELSFSQQYSTVYMSSLLGSMYIDMIVHTNVHMTQGNTHTHTHTMNPGTTILVQFCHIMGITSAYHTTELGQTQPKLFTGAATTYDHAQRDVFVNIHKMSRYLELSSLFMYLWSIRHSFSFRCMYQPDLARLVSPEMFWPLIAMCVFPVPMEYLYKVSFVRLAAFATCLFISFLIQECRRLYP